MSRHVKGIIAMPSFSPDIQAMITRTSVDPITPQCTEYEVRYRQGRQLVNDKLIEVSKLSETVYDSSFLTTFSKHFIPPVIGLETPVGTLMYYAGINFALGQINDYMQDIGD